MGDDAQVTEAMRQWLKFPTWELKEGLLLLMGIDPYRAACFSFNATCTEFEVCAPPGSLPLVHGHPVGVPTWHRIGHPPRAEVGADGVPRAVGAVFEPSKLLELHTLMECWHRTPGHDGMVQASPAHFIAWSERVGMPPPWLDAVRLAGLLPTGMAPPGEPQAVQKKREALVKQYVGAWPSIDRDLKDASANGLREQAGGDKHGWWREAEALDWARARGKLQDRAVVPSTVFSMGRRTD